MSWRLYSWMRFTCTSTSASESTSRSQCFFTHFAIRSFASFFTATHFAWKSLSSLNLQMPRMSERSFSQASLPSFSVMSFDSPGFAQWIQRRGVTPLVQFTNLPGSPLSKDHLYRFVKVSRFTISVCMYATPFTWWAPMTEMLPILRHSPPSASPNIDMSQMCSPSPHLAFTSSKNMWFIMPAISTCLGSSLPIRSMRHFSSASGITVWFV
mmetsp:Transcript_18913/g.48510  ORF Transcript_18913/g.48510 Transcript_18913/m.48510 type:complete len:211 (+) Transcript_18913:1309-1941(+)